MKFDKTFCSQCGRDFGPGDHDGYSDCRSHGDRTEERNAIVEKWIEAQMLTPLNALMQFGNQGDRDKVEAALVQGFSTDALIAFTAVYKMREAIEACVIRAAWDMTGEIMREHDKMREIEAFRALDDAA